MFSPYEMLVIVVGGLLVTGFCYFVGWLFEQGLSLYYRIKDRRRRMREIEDWWRRNFEPVGACDDEEIPF